MKKKSDAEHKMRTNWLAAIMQRMNGELWRAANRVCQHCDAVSKKKKKKANIVLKYIHRIVNIRCISEDLL